MRVVTPILITAALLAAIVGINAATSQPPRSEERNRLSIGLPQGSRELDRVLRSGDLEAARRAVVEDPTAADQLFLAYLQQGVGSLVPSPLLPARRLAEVFRQIYEYDFELGVVEYWRETGDGEKRVLLPLLQDHFSLHQRYRDTLPRLNYGGDIESRTTGRRLLADRFLALAARYREIPFPKGEMQALLVAGGLAREYSWRTLERAQELDDELALAWASYAYRPYENWIVRWDSRQQAREHARRLGLPKLEVRSLLELGLFSRQPEQQRSFYEEALTLARDLPLDEAVAERLVSDDVPLEIQSHLHRWMGEEKWGESETADSSLEEARELGRRIGGQAGEVAVLATGVHIAMEYPNSYGGLPEIFESAVKLAKGAAEPNVLAAILWKQGKELGFQDRCEEAIPALAEALRLYRELGAESVAAEVLVLRGECRLRIGETALGESDLEQAVQTAERLDKPYLTAKLHFDAGNAAMGRAPETATRYLEQAAAVAKEADAPILAALAMDGISHLATHLGHTEKTLDQLRDALVWAARNTQRWGDPSFEFSLALNHLAREYAYSQGDPSAALKVANRVADEAGAQGIPEWEAKALWFSNSFYLRMGELTLAVDSAERALRLFDELGLTEMSRRCLMALGGLNTNLNRPDRTLPYYDRALEIALQRKEEDRQGAVYGARAHFFREAGDYDAALAEHEKVFALIEKIQDPADRNDREALWLQSIAYVHALANELPQATRYAREAIAKELQAPPGRRILLYSKTGIRPPDILLLAGHHEEAIQYLTARRERARRDHLPQEEGMASERLGNAYLSVGKLGDARQAFLAAAELERAKPTFLGAGALLGLGRVELEAGNLDEAEQHFVAARDAADPWGRWGEGQPWQIERALAQTAVRRRDLRRADLHYLKAFEALEELQERAPPVEFRLRFGADRQDIYDEYAAWLASRASETGDRGTAEQAFQVAERRRAQSSWDLLMRGFAESPNHPIPERVQRLQQLDARVVAKQRALREYFDSPPEARNDDFIAGLVGDLEKIKADHARLLGSVAQQELRYATLPGQDSDLLNRLFGDLGPDRVLLEYLVTDDGVFAFVVSDTDLQVVPLPVEREELRRQVEQLRRPIDDLRSGSVDLYRLMFDLELAQQLHDELWAPVASHLGSATRVLIVPDDVLHYLPFELLVRQAPSAAPSGDVLFGRYAEVDFLVRHFTLTYLTAAGSLQPTSGQASSPVEPTRLLVMADPTAAAPGTLDPPSSFDPASSPDPARPLRRALRSADLGWALTAPPGSIEEVDRIHSLFPAEQLTVVVGKEATETSYKSLAGEHDIIHLATHALASDEDPLHSTLVLAPGSDGGEDGFLQAYEILRHPLQAQLVVLSGCETALGPLQQGEGIVGLVRAFQQAGARSVLATLWSVDESAAETVAGVYRGLIAGRDPASALREAKLALLETRTRMGSVEVSLAHPFFWAPFVLNGVTD